MLLRTCMSPAQHPAAKTNRHDDVQYPPRESAKQCHFLSSGKPWTFQVELRLRLPSEIFPHPHDARLFM